MRRALISFIGVCLLVYGCGSSKAPKGPYVPLVSRLDAESDVVFIVDLASLSRGFDKLRKTVTTVPIVAAHPELKRMIEQQLNILDSSLALARGMLGFDVLKDFHRMAIGIHLKQNGEVPSVVAVIDGKIPPGVFQKVLPGVNPEKKFGTDVWTIPESGFQVAIEGGKTLVACSGDMTEKRLKGGDVSETLLKHHPELFRDDATKSYLRMSFFMAPWIVIWAKQEMDQAPDLMMVESLFSVRQLFVDVADQVEVSLVCADDNGADHVKNLLQAEAEMMMGGRQLIRGITFMSMALDLDLLDGLPPEIRTALADRKAQEQSLDFLFPESQKAPRVEVDGKKVTLLADLGMLKGSLSIIGILASVAVPSFIKYQQAVKNERAEMELEQKKQNEALMKMDSAPKVNPDGTLRMDDSKGAAKKKEAR